MNAHLGNISMCGRASLGSFSRGGQASAMDVCMKPGVRRPPCSWPSVSRSAPSWESRVVEHVDGAVRLAEDGGFEPPEGVNPNTLSKSANGCSSTADVVPDQAEWGATSARGHRGTRATETRSETVPAARSRDERSNDLFGVSADQRAKPPERGELAN